MHELIDPRSDSVRVFLRRWYGATTAGRPAIALESDQIPRELVDWHDAVASTGVAVTFHNRPVELSKLVRSDNGMMIFWMENQGSYYWAVDPDDEQPAVFVTVYPTEEPWQATGETLRGFLLHCTIDEAMLGAAARFVVMIPGRVAQSYLSNWFVPLGFPHLANQDPSTQLLCSHDALAQVCPPPVGYSIPGDATQMLSVAVTNPDDLDKYQADLRDYLSTVPRQPPVEIDELPPF
ncbi:hypothetical protein [Dactylosporangium darangshiense]|uniref:hypothetical protein n=1 Tax=Dactylosporangium darangshiense TaxID=579108 RepID=UPI0031EE66AC